MNRNLVIIAAVIALATAFIVTEIDDESDGSGSTGTTYYVMIDGLKYWCIEDANTKLYGNGMLLSENVYISCGKVRECAFKNCTDLKRIYCSISVTSVGDSAFEGCTNLIYANLSRVATIGSSAFMNSGVSEIVTGSSLNTVGEYAFANCKSLSAPILADTSVTTLNRGTFFNSNIIADDIRGITTLDETAFQDADIYCIAMKTSQILCNDTPIRIYDDEKQFTKLSYYSDDGDEGVKFRVNRYAVMDPHDKDGNAIRAVSSTVTENTNIVTYCTIVLTEGVNCYLSTGSTTVHFQEALGLPDATVRTGGSDYTLPTAPVLGDLDFLGWTVPGIEGYVTSLTAQTIGELWPTVEPVACYSASTVSFDHSQLDAPLAAALPTSMEFSFGSVYPDLEDTGDMGFACWIVNGEVFEPGDLITTYCEHTASSVWAENGMFTVTVHDCSAGIYSTMEVVCTSSLRLEDIAFIEPEDRLLVGWSLTDGGDKIKDDTIRPISDTDVYPVTKNRSKYTITYMDGFNPIGSQTFYEQRKSDINVELPYKEGMRFVRWVCDGTEYHMGDPIQIDKDMTFYAEWVTVPTYTVSYDTVPRTELRYSEGTEITIGTDIEPPEHKFLSGWTEAEGSFHADGSTIIVTDDLAFSPVWSDCPQYKASFHGPDGTVTIEKMYSDETLILTAPSERTGFTFSGWSLDEDDGPEYGTGDSLTLEEDIDLYEVWTENSLFFVTVHNDSNDTYSAHIGETISIVLEPFEREGFVQRGWSLTEEQGSPDYDPSCTVELDGSADIYPVWERLMILMYHDGNDTMTEYHEKESTAELKVLEKNGYEFLGWSREPKGAIIYGKTIVIREDMDLYASWAEPSETVEEPDEEPSEDTASTGSGGVDDSYIMMGASAATVAIITTLLAIQIRRN